MFDGGVILARERIIGVVTEAGLGDVFPVLERMVEGFVTGGEEGKRDYIAFLDALPETNKQLSELIERAEWKLKGKTVLNALVELKKRELDEIKGTN